MNAHQRTIFLAILMIWGDDLPAFIASSSTALCHVFFGPLSPSFLCRVPAQGVFCYSISLWDQLVFWGCVLSIAILFFLWWHSQILVGIFSSVPILVVFLEDRKGLCNVTSFWLWSQCVIIFNTSSWKAFFSRNRIRCTTLINLLMFLQREVFYGMRLLAPCPISSLEDQGFM